MKKFILINGFLALLLNAEAFTAAPAAAVDPLTGQENYSLSQGAAIAIPAREAKLPFVIFGDALNVKSFFIPSGFMGDSASLKLLSAHESAPVSSGKKGKTSLKVVYNSRGRNAWAGICWLTPANNWGKIKGAGYNFTGAKNLVFWMRGEKGGEHVADVKLGGVNGPFPDTDAASSGPLHLTSEWRRYVIDLSGKDLRHIIGGFSFLVRRADNPRGASFFIDEISVEGESPSVPAMADPALEKIPPAAVEKPSPVTTDEPRLPGRMNYVIPFANASAKFASESKKVIDEIVSMAKEFPTSPIRVEGHTDNIGSADTNQKLSLQRASAVADYLELQGVEAGRLTVEGYGEDQPISPEFNKTPEGRHKNRRVEVTLTPE